MNRLTKSVASLMLALSAFSFSSCDDGSDVIGLNGSTKYGYIKVTLEGVDPEGKAFKETKNFKFASSGTPAGSSSVITYEDDGFYRYFQVDRYITPFDGGDDSSVSLELGVEDENDPFLSYGYFYLETSVITEGNKFFALSESFYLDGEDITSYKYNPDTGKLSVKFTKEEVEASSTGNLLTLTVDVSVKVFEDIGNQPGL